MHIHILVSGKKQNINKQDIMANQFSGGGGRTIRAHMKEIKVWILSISLINKWILPSSNGSSQAFLN